MANEPDIVLEEDTVSVRSSGGSPVLDVEGGNNWDLGESDGDVRVGTDEHMLKMGVSTGGGGAGNGRLWASRYLRLGGEDQSVVTVNGDGLQQAGDGYSLGSRENPWAGVYGFRGRFEEELAVDGGVKIGENLTMLGEDEGGNALIKRVVSQELSVSQTVLSGLVPDSGGLNLGDSGSPWDTVHARTVNKQSDARLKSDVSDIDGGLDAVMDLRPVSYRWHDGEETHLGLLAQEVADVLPEAVDLPDDVEDGYRGIDYTELVAVLVDAVQDQQAEKDALEDRVEDQQGQIETQQKRIDDLEERLDTLEQRR